MELQNVAVGLLRPHANNTRDPKEDVGELVASIKEHGILQPLVARKEGKTWTVLIGHRRLQAAKALGMADVPVLKAEGDEARALEILVTDNAQHSPPDPLREAEAVAALMNGGTWKITDVADRLGKPVRWVAQRRAMAGLSPVVVEKFRAGKLPTFTPAMLATLAGVAPAVQEDLVKQRVNAYEAWDAKGLADAVNDELRVLGKAPWPLDDAQLVPKAGACSACPKTSLASPGLFDDGEPGVGPAALKKAQCRDSACWKGKFEAFSKAKVAALRAEHPGLVIVQGAYDGAEDDDRAYETYLEGGEQDGVLGDGEYDRCARDAKGAVPAFVVTGKGAGQLTWIKGVTQRGEAKVDQAARVEKGEPAKKEPTLKQRQEALEDRRRAYILDAVREHVCDKFPAPHARIVSALICAYGVDGMVVDHPSTHGTKAATRRGVYDEVDHDRRANWPHFATRVWPGVANRIEQALNRLVPARLGEQYEELLWLCEVLDVDVKPFRAAAEKEIQPSKALQAQLAAQKAKGK